MAIDFELRLFGPARLWRRGEPVVVGSRKAVLEGLDGLADDVQGRA